MLPFIFLSEANLFSLALYIKAGKSANSAEYLTSLLRTTLAKKNAAECIDRVKDGQTAGQCQKTIKNLKNGMQ